MRSYEIVLVFRSSLTDAQRRKILDAVKDWLKSLKIIKEDNLGEKTLAYPIKRERKGSYIALSLEGDVAIPTDLDKRFSANEDILRYLVIRKK